MFDVLLLNFDTSVPTCAVSHRLCLKVIKAEKFYCRLLCKYKPTKAAIATIKTWFLFSFLLYIVQCCRGWSAFDCRTLFYVTIPRLLRVRYWQLARLEEWGCNLDQTYVLAVCARACVRWEGPTLVINYSQARVTELGALPVLSTTAMQGNPAWLIDPASVRPSINRGPSGPVRNTLFRGKLVNQLALHRSLMVLAPLLSVSANQRVLSPALQHWRHAQS